MMKWGFEYGLGGNKAGTAEFRNRLTAANIPQCYKGADDAGLVYEAQESGHPDSVLIYRVSTAGQQDGNDYDTPFYQLHPQDAAVVHYGITVNKWPPELDPSRVLSEPINEPRAKPDLDKPNYNNMHPVDWLGEFMTEYAILANADGRRVCGPAFNSGEPEPADYGQPGMLRWLRYCADNPGTAALSAHEYNFGSVPYAENYPWHYGRFQAAIAAADLAGIPRTFRIFITEFGWERADVPDWQTAVSTIEQYSLLSARFPQLEAAAIWSLRSGWGTIDNQLVQWIADNGNPFTNWLINNQYPTAEQPQATAVEFGGTLPTPPPDNGENNMTEEVIQSDNLEFPRIEELRQQVNNVRVVVQSRIDGSWANNDHVINIPIEAKPGIERRVVVQRLRDKPVNPKPTPVVSNPLPQGASFADVSANNKLVNLATLKSKGVTGIGIRLSNGVRKNTDTTDENGVDKMAQHYIEEAESIDMPWLGYHYSNENYDDVEQVRHFLGIANQFIADGHIPEMGLWLDFETPKLPVQGSPTTEPRIQLQLTTLANERPSFIGDYGPYTSAGWWNGKVPNAAVWVPTLGLKSWVAAWVPITTLVNGWPPAWWKPFPLKGFADVYYWQWTSAGGLLVDHSVASLDLNFVGNTAVVPGTQPDPNPDPNPDPKPTGKTVDTLPYFQPSGQFGRCVVFHFSDGRTQPQQMEKLPDGRTILWKGEGMNIDSKVVYDYEEILVDTDGVKKFKDTSSGGRTAYDLDGVVWLPRIVEIGKVYKSSPTVREFDRVTCQTAASNKTTDYIYVKELLPVWTSPIDPSITFESVLVCEWRKTPDINTPPLEVYKLAKETLYVEWNNGAVGELPEGRWPLSFYLTDCE